MPDDTLSLEEREKTLGGIGTARKRKEDNRFIQGKGNYIDDHKLPGMLHGDFLRSSHAHARIKSINAQATRTRASNRSTPMPPRRCRASSRCLWPTT